MKEEILKMKTKLQLEIAFLKSMDYLLMIQ